MTPRTKEEIRAEMEQDRIASGLPMSVEIGQILDFIAGDLALLERKVFDLADQLFIETTPPVPVPEPEPSDT